MPKRVLAVALSAVAAPALGQRASTTEMSCSQAKPQKARTLVDRRGGLVLGTGGQTDDRFVRDRSFCAVTEITVPAFVPAGDTPRCCVGDRCREPGRDDGFDGGF